MLGNRRSDYATSSGVQVEKGLGVSQSKSFVSQIRELLSPHLAECAEYEPPAELRLRDAPAVLLPDMTLAIAPDLRCVTRSGKVFWVEPKDKAQRWKHPDTGADLHQAIGYYDVWRTLSQPVLLVYQDPADVTICIGETATDIERHAYEERWSRFGGRPYGNWLSELYRFDSHNNYPRLFLERSRRDPMWILYQHVDQMISLENRWAELVAQVDNETVPALEVPLRAYRAYPRGILSEAEIRTLKVGGATS